MVTDEKQEFSNRLNRLLDMRGFPVKGKNRQGQLGREMNVSQKGARKWLEAESIPNMENLVSIAKKYGVAFEWLATGRGPMTLEKHKYQDILDVLSGDPPDKLIEIMRGQIELMGLSRPNGLKKASTGNATVRGSR